MIWYSARTIAGGLVALLVGAFIAYACLPAPQVPGAGTDVGAFFQSFGSWVIGAFSGSLGVSTSQAAPAGLLIGERLAVSLPLIVLAGLVTSGIGVGLGLGATGSNGLVRRPLAALAAVLDVIPALWSGMLLIVLFSATLHWLPAGGYVAWTTNFGAAVLSLILPSIALGLPLGASLALKLRRSIIDVRSSAMMRAALARGLGDDEAFRRHGRRNVLLVVLNASGPLLLAVIVGAFVIETVFYLPGLGRLLLDAALARDAVLVRAAVLMMMTIIAVVVLLHRLAIGWADPRIFGRAAS